MVVFIIFATITRKIIYILSFNYQLMKKLFFLCLVMLPFAVLSQRGLAFDYDDLKIIPADYDLVAEKFKSHNKESLTSLRQYIISKQEVIDELDEKILGIENDRTLNMLDTVIAQQYLNKVDSAKIGALVDDEIIQYLGDFGYMPEFYGERKIADLRIITDRVRNKLRELRKDNKLVKVLYVSYNNVHTDMVKAQERVDKMYGELYDEGNFRMWITCIFSICVGGLLLFFFVFITKRAETALVKDFLASGNGLQFITLFSLVIAVILFGVLGILEGRELAAILSGISGYILGKGIQSPLQSHKNDQNAGAQEGENKQV